MEKSLLLSMVLVLLVGFNARATTEDFIRSRTVLLQPPVEQPNLIDHDENFLNPTRLNGLKFWHTAALLQPLQQKIAQELVLPNSLINSFIIYAEGYANPPGQKAAVIFLVGEAGGNGKTQLVEQYAKASGRSVHKFSSLRNEWMAQSELEAQILSIALIKNNPIFFFDEFDRNSDQYVATVKRILTKNRQAFGRATVIFSVSATMGAYFEPVAELVTGAQDLFKLKNRYLNSEQQELANSVRELASTADSIHVIRNPLSAEYYRAILELWLPRALTNLANRRQVQEVRLNQKDEVLTQLAAAAFAMQKVHQTSQLRLLWNSLHSPNPDQLQRTGQCGNLMSGTTEAQIAALFKMVKAVGTYQSSLHTVK